MPTRADVVHPSSMGVNVTRPMTLGGTHPPSMGASVVGPTPAHVGAQLGSGVDVVSRTSELWPILGLGQRMQASMLPCVRVYRCRYRSRLLRPSRCCCWVVVLRSLSRQPTLACISGYRLPEQPHLRLVRLALSHLGHLVAPSYNRCLLLALKRQRSCRPPFVRRVCHVRLGVA